ncbi:MAG TPA: phosphomannomutase/phosphoglucomutase, partial [Actinopolymorphaceae bacterium]
MAEPEAIFKAYDIRGVVPDQLDADLARRIGAAFVDVLRADDPDLREIAVGHDMRPSSPDLVAAFAEGVTNRGADVIDIGLASTDELYFVSGYLDRPGAMFTASHNPPQYNGIKLCRAGASPIGRDSGLSDIRALLDTELPPRDGPAGSVRQQDFLQAYADYLLSLVDLSTMRRLKVVVDAGNGMAGHTVPTVFADLNVDLVPLYFELDGTFPHHEANPIEP